ncbi:MAG: winged helix-turn-helix domain-containing protein [Candidatus Diapherotrites archaeon]
MVSMEEESNLVKFFGGSPFIRILDAFIDNIGSDYSKKEIEQLAGISKGALFKHWKKLEDLNLIKVKRQFGNTNLYVLNTESEIIKNLLNLEMDMIEETSPKAKLKAVAK